MKKTLTFLFSLVIISCGSQLEERENVNEEIGKEVVTLSNFNNTGVNFRLESTGVTRAYGVIDEYELESEMPDGIVLKGIIRVETLLTGHRVVELYRFDEYVLDEEYVGSYMVDRNMIVRAVEVAASNPLTDLTEFVKGPDIDPEILEKLGINPTRRLAVETYWQCVRREYQEMKKAYENRLLDDIACDIVAPACKVLALVAAAYECGK